MKFEKHKIGKYSEGSESPLKERRRSQLVVEEITGRAGKLAQSLEYKDIWLKRNMNLEERQKEKDLKKQEAKEKREEMLLKGVRHETEKVVLFRRERK